MDFMKHRMTASGLISTIPGLNERLMQVWINRGVIKVEDKCTGTGKRRLYSFKEALVIALIHEMTKMSELTKVSGPAASMAADFFCSDEWVDCPEYILLIHRQGKKPKMSIVERREFDLDNYRDFVKILDFTKVGNGLMNRLGLKRSWGRVDQKWTRP